jgi:hypothetical protein
VKEVKNRVYNNTFDTLFKTYRNEGLRGVQRGLGPAYVYQVLVNGARLGFYEPLRRSSNTVLGINPEEQNAFTSVLAGASSGVIGSVMANPLFLVKARMQVSKIQGTWLRLVLNAHRHIHQPCQWEHSGIIGAPWLPYLISYLEKVPWG